MASRLRPPSPALIVALIALFVSIGGVGYAASKIDTNDIKNKAVTKPKIDKQAVSTNRIVKQAVKPSRLAGEAVKTNKLADLAVTSDKLGDLAVTTGKLADDSVVRAKVADGAIGAAELGSTQQIVSGTQNIAGMAMARPRSRVRPARRCSAEVVERAASRSSVWSPSEAATAGLGSLTTPTPPRTRSSRPRSAWSHRAEEPVGKSEHLERREPTRAPAVLAHEP
jgi:hypothetical protein